MNSLIQLVKKESEGELPADSSIRSLMIFALHRSIFDNEKKTFIHFLMVIGYSGGGCQEECFYKIEGSNLEKSTVLISTSSGDLFYQFSFQNQNCSELEKELNEFDKQIQLEFTDSINNHLSYNSELGYYFYDNLNSIINNGLMITDKFPIRILRFLKNVYWPFSVSW